MSAVNIFSGGSIWGEESSSMPVNEQLCEADFRSIHADYYLTIPLKKLKSLQIEKI
ncbi:hypothetical protein C0J52_26823 [Blattella germanica]|nr:hypothetical protein C0J52_26823 [Blattella germanica]